MKKLFSLLLAVMMLAFSMSCASAQIIDGTYEAEATGMFDGLKIAVTFAGGKISDVAVVASNETAGICDTAMERIPAAIVENNSILVDTVAGATMTSNGIISAVKKAIEAAGGNVADFETAIAQKEIDRTEKTLDVDVVVAGAGIAGLTAAVTAAEEGASVVLLEKMPVAGGSLSLSGGNFASVNSAVAKEFGADDNKETTMTFWQWSADQSFDQTTGYPDMERVEILLDKIDGLLTWMKNHGIPYYKATDANVNTVAKVYTEGKGAAVTATLEKAALDAGVTILYETPAVEIIMKDGKAVGLKAQSATENITINASKGVLLATGGFGANPELLAQWVPGYAGAKSSVAASHTADGHLMAQAAGAALYDNMWVMPGGLSLYPEVLNNVQGASSLSYTHYGNNVLVNAEGTRYTNEYIGGAYAVLTNAVAAENSSGNYYIFDSAEATDPAVLPVLQEGAEKGVIVKADTIEALAELLNMPNLAATMETYNSYCASGSDPDFGKDPAHLIAYSAEGPYYALQVMPSFLGSMGGVVTDVNGRAYDVNGNVIEGLYAAGEMSNRSFYNQVYVGAASLSLYPVSAQLAVADMLK